MVIWEAMLIHSGLSSVVSRSLGRSRSDRSAGLRAGVVVGRYVLPALPRVLQGLAISPPLAHADAVAPARTLEGEGLLLGR